MYYYIDLFHSQDFSSRIFSVHLISTLDTSFSSVPRLFFTSEPQSLGYETLSISLHLIYTFTFSIKIQINFNISFRGYIICTLYNFVLLYRMKFHRDCAAKAAPACGLPNELVDIILDSIRNNDCECCKGT